MLSGALASIEETQAASSPPQRIALNCGNRREGPGIEAEQSAFLDGDIIAERTAIGDEVDFLTADMNEGRRALAGPVDEAIVSLPRNAYGNRANGGRRGFGQNHIAPLLANGHVAQIQMQV